MTGSTLYEIDVVAHDGTLHLSCSCPYAGHAGACKHLWAVLCVCDTNGTLAPLLTVAGNRYVTTFGVDDARESDSLNEAVESGPQLPPVPTWKRVLDSARLQMQTPLAGPNTAAAATWPGNRRLVYILDLEASATSDGVTIELGTELRARDGSWGDAKRFTLGTAVWFAAPDAADLVIAAMLCGADDPYGYGNRRGTTFVVPFRTFDTTLRAILETGRCRVRSSRPELTGRTLRHDGGAPWTFRLRVSRDDGDTLHVHGILARDAAQMDLGLPVLLHPAGYLIADDVLARYDHAGAFPLMRTLRQHGAGLPVPEDVSELLTSLYALPHVPAIELPAGLSIVESHDDPRRAVTITERVGGWNAVYACNVDCEFVYGTLRIDGTSTTSSVFDPVGRVLHHRQLPAERQAVERLLALGVKREWDYRRSAHAMIIARSRMSTLVLALAREGWQVTVGGRGYAAPGAIHATVSSGIDWFDLHGSVRYGDVDVPIATILDARRRRDEFVQVSEGVMGLLPLEWLNRLGPLLGAGDTVGGGVRYRRTQLSLLDALLATLPEVDVDATFEQARTALATFGNVAPADAPPTFTGTLREYQREGLGWLHFLRKFGLGGCLADDMGLGKTVQVLALLETRRLEGHGPSIVVVPRSLVFNWLREAGRFTPALRMKDFSQGERKPESIDATQVDVIVTTYGSLRRDAPMLAGVEFDYAILDEAQAIKNASTATAKASRLLRARHRLAMSGTPIENRIEELWSLLEFLNPGMLGASATFASAARQMAAPAVDDARIAHDVVADGQSVLARALRPLILRRTKEHVAPELPERIEQTLEVELEPKQRKFYDAVRVLAQRTVMARVARDGIQKSQLHILEALLRLRQAACHPALADPSKHALPSAKLDALVPALIAIAAEGHKSLVFSQFTELLALVRQRLDAEGVRYEYLDGRTRDRQARVDRFQDDADCPVFLISLKAGGQGLNLTAADYVYLLDPWWNPAVEAQAIDRAHRIGQTRRVVATRLVARDTIEAKILALQATKRALADSVLTADRGGLASIGRAELELLLS